MQRADIVANADTTQFIKEFKEGKSKSDKKKRKQDWLAALLLWPTYTDAMRAALAPLLYTLIVETGQDAIQQVGLEPSQFDQTSLDVLNYAQERGLKIATDVNAETEKQVRASLGQGIDNNENDDQLRARIEVVMGAALTYRADRIARTETTRALGFADVTAWKQAGNVSGKEWYVQSRNPCAFCTQLDGVIVSLDDNYYTLGDVVEADGKKLSINYENVPAPPVHVNCQCVLLPVLISA